MNKEQARNLVRQTLTESFDKARFQKFVLELLNEFDESKAQSMAVPDAFAKDVRSCMRLGTYRSPDKELLDVLIVNTTEPWKLERTRSALRNFVAHKLKRGDNEKDAALVAFVSPSEKQWRFSYVKMEYATVEKDSGKIGVETKLTPARRFSYIVGEGESCHTAQTRFLGLLQDTEKDPSLAQIEEAFSVEAVTKEFFKKYADLFGEIQNALDKLAKKDSAIAKEFDKKNVRTADFAKKLMGQIVFLYFIQKKGWLGVEKGNDWGTGPHDFLRRLARAEYGKYENFFNDVLEPLFYDTLATDRGHEAWCKRFNCRIPFLNGGLFEPLADYNWRKTDITLSNRLFTNNDRFDDFSTGTGLLDMFDRYNFTVNEAEPLEKEVAIDPEMLGKVFENLIEENLRKGLGSYYTPREIVHYMCQEALINYLDTALNSATETIGKEKRKQAEFGDERAEQTLLTAPARNEIVPRTDIETFIRLGDQISHYEAVETRYAIKMPKNIEKHARPLDEKLANITICDPAVGSGAFPVGMMTEIVRARSALTPYFNDVNDRTPYHFKRHAIQDCLYGVDIDAGAVEIAKLRLWLSLVVDEEEVKQIKPLPNLDFKIVSGNSLLDVDKDELANWQAFRRLEEIKPKFFDEADGKRKQGYKREIDQLIHQLTNAKETFDFEIYFSEVFHRRKGFDVLIANPPYGAELQELGVVLRAKYRSITNSLDSFIMFIERATDLLIAGGTLSYIVPSGWVSTPSCRKLRALFTESFAPIVFVSLPYDQFASAYVDTIVVVARRLPEDQTWAGLDDKSVRLVVFPIRYPLRSTRDFFAFEKGGDLDLWGNPAESGFLVSASKTEAALVAKIRRCPKCLDDYVEVMRGIETFHPKPTALSRSAKPALMGDIYRYQLVNGPPGFLNYGKDLESSKPWRYFAGPRILLRQLLSRKFRLQAVYAEKPFLTNQSVQSLIPESDGGPTLKAILGVLNSALMSWYFCQINMVARRDDFPKTIIKQTRELPIPDLEQSLAKPTASKLEKVVDRVLTVKGRNGDTDTTALEQEIDHLVYALYELTPEEIQIVEESAQR